jgi:hypothetical protein
LKRIYQPKHVGEDFNNKLKVFRGEDLLETDDGLIYPRYRDMNYDCCLTDAEFQEFCTMYKSTFKHECCADLALKIMIQDIASGFRDNSGIIKFYYGTGGNNKTCEYVLYENIIGHNELTFSIHDYKVLADEKNERIVSSLYVQFEEMPAVTSATSEKFTEFINALKNYNECGKVKTRSLFKDFVTINTNIRFQCNTNYPILADTLLENANDAIKRRFLVAERIKSDEHSSNLYLFCHDVNKCRALKMYIKTHAKELYTYKLNTMSMLQFYKDHADIYARAIESTRNDTLDSLAEALKSCPRLYGKRKTTEDEEFVVDLKEWRTQYNNITREKLLQKQFNELVKDYTDYVKVYYKYTEDDSGSRVYTFNDKSKTNKYVLKATATVLINALQESADEVPGISLE